MSNLAIITGLILTLISAIALVASHGGLEALGIMAAIWLAIACPTLILVLAFFRGGSDERAGE